MTISEITNRVLKMHGNSKVVAKNALFAFIIKGVALTISFFSTPIFIRYFNDNGTLGVWYTMLSILTWFLTFDLGIGNGIRNHLVKSLSNNERIETRRIISSGCVAIGTTTLILSLIGVTIILNLNLNALFNISDLTISSKVLRISTLMVFASIMLRFFLTTVSSIYYALQKSAVNNFLALCVSILQLIYILVFRFDNPETSLLNISFAYLLISNLPVLTAGIIIFFKDLKDCRPHYIYIHKATINKIMGIGIVFFLCQIFYMVIVNTNEFFISYFWEPSNTTDYTFYYKVTMLLSIMASLALTPMWSMITKAYAEQNYQWVNHFFLLVKKCGFIVLVIELSLVPFLQSIMDIWLGKGVLKVHYPTAMAFACFGSVFIYSTMLSTIVCGLARMKLQSWCYGTGALFKIAIIPLISSHTTYWPWIVWIDVCVLIPYCVLEHIALNKLFRKLIVNESI